MNVIKTINDCGIDFVYVDNVEGLPHVTYPYTVIGGYTFIKPDLTMVVDNFINQFIEKENLMELFENKPIYFQRCNVSRCTHKYEYVNMKGIKRFLYKHFFYIFRDLKDIIRDGYHRGFYQFYKEFK